MAIGTYRAGEQAFLLQSYSVDTGRVIYDHIPFFDSRHPCRLSPLAVTFAAKARDIGPIRRGILVPRGQYIMLAMTVGAVGDILFFLEIGPSVAAIIIVFGHPRMAVGAVNPSGGCAGAREAGIYIGVAFHTGNIFVS